MSLPETGLEQALSYTSFSADGSLEVSSQMGDDQRRAQYGTLLDQVQDPNKVAALLVRLEEDNPYFQLCSDENIHAYFQRFGISIASQRDLELFNETLGERVRTLADSNETVKAQLAERDYKRELGALPSVISKLEEQVHEYGALKKPFSAVMRYVWEAVTQEDFRMHEEGSKATEPYEGKITIEPHELNPKAVHIKIKLSNEDEDELDFVLKPTYKTKKVTIERSYWLNGNKEVTTDEVENLTLLPIILFNKLISRNFHWSGRQYIEDGIIYKDKSKKVILMNQSSDFVDMLVQETLTKPDQYSKYLETYLKLILNFPKIMHNYTDRTRVNLGTVLERITSDYTNNK
ncbi:hypothetical protein HQ489_02580 [Candidatus Woesearchaeota archaeon]|nr:hypothetical protein [Candidatus Woesearchaeota archaeon]